MATDVELDVEDVPAPVLYPRRLATLVTQTGRRELPERHAGHVVTDPEAKVIERLVVGGQPQQRESLVKNRLGVLRRTLAREAEHLRRLLVVQFAAEWLSRQDLAQLGRYKDGVFGVWTSDVDDGHLGVPEIDLVLCKENKQVSQRASLKDKVLRTPLEILLNRHLPVEFVALEPGLLRVRRHDILQRLRLLISQMTRRHLELLRKAAQHPSFRLLVELADGVGEVTRLVKRRHAHPDVDHEFFVDRTGGHEETPPGLDPYGQLHGSAVRGEKISVLGHAHAIAGRVVL